MKNWKILAGIEILAALINVSTWNWAYNKEIKHEIKDYPAQQEQTAARQIWHFFFDHGTWPDKMLDKMRGI